MSCRFLIPPPNLVGFAIEYQEPNGTQFYAVTNRISFAANGGSTDPNIHSGCLSPIQKFHWVHIVLIKLQMDKLTKPCIVSGIL